MPDSKKRKKKAYYIVKKKPRLSDCLRPGKHGFVITCMDVRQRKSAISEAYSILNEYADKLYGPEKIISEKEEDEDEEETSIEDALKKEVSDIKKSNSKDAVRRFQNLPTKGKNVIFISTTLEEPTVLLNEIYNDLINTQIKKTKYCLRFLPVIATCYAKTDEIVKTVKQIIEPIFVEQKEHEVKRFSIVWKTRCNNSVKRDDILPPILDFIFSKVDHKTDYNNPEIAINIDVIGNTCCIGLLHNFVKFRKYNIDMIVEVKGEKDEKSKQADELESCGDTLESDNDNVDDEDSTKENDTEIRITDASENKETVIQNGVENGEPHQNDCKTVDEVKSVEEASIISDNPDMKKNTESVIDSSINNKNE